MKAIEKILIPSESIINAIFQLRGKRIMIDSDLASLYGVETKVLKQSVNRNIDRFPEDFMFEISKKEKSFLIESAPRLSNLKHSSANPYVFTEHGVVMLASIIGYK